MADVRDDFVVAGRFDCRGGGAEIAPETGGGFRGTGVGVFQRREKTGAMFEETGGRVFPTGFFRAGHRVRADEVRARTERGVAEAGDFAFHAADVGDDRAGREMRGDLLREWDDAVDGRGNDDNARAAHGFLGRVGDGVTPRLSAQREADLGPARPEHDARRHAARPGRTRHRATEQAGGENGELGESRHDGPKTQNPRVVSSPSASLMSGDRVAFFGRASFLKT